MLPLKLASKPDGRAERSSQTPGGEPLPPRPLLQPRGRGTCSCSACKQREAGPAEPKRTIPSLKEKPEKGKEPKTAADVVSGANSVDSRVQRPKEESLEMKLGVSFWRSGRSKQFYNQTFGAGSTRATGATRAAAAPDARRGVLKAVCAGAATGLPVPPERLRRPYRGDREGGRGRGQPLGQHT